jgi:hypothetical protein
MENSKEMSKDEAISLNKSLVYRANTQLVRVKLAREAFLQLVKRDMEAKYKEKIKVEPEDLEDELGQWVRHDGDEYDMLYYETLKAYDLLKLQWQEMLKECSGNLEKLGFKSDGK